MTESVRKLWWEEDPELIAFMDWLGDQAFYQHP